MSDFGTEGNPTFYDAIPEDRTTIGSSGGSNALDELHPQHPFSLWRFASMSWSVFCDRIARASLFRRDKQRKP
jgi:hypothetical protein